MPVAAYGKISGEKTEDRIYMEVRGKNNSPVLEKDKLLKKAFQFTILKTYLLQITT
jgi:hypothetical protein